MGKKVIKGETEARKVRAVGRYLRISAQKAGSVARQVRGLHLVDAQNQLTFMVKKGSRLILKILNSAAANAAARSLNKSKLVISRIEVGAGPPLKRGNPVSRGVFHPILKKTAHVLVELREES